MRAVVYTNPFCQPCKATKRHLSRLKAEYTEVPLDDDLRAIFRREGFLMAPIVQAVDDEWESVAETWTGYDPDKIDEYFKGEK